MKILEWVFLIITNVITFVGLFCWVMSGGC